MSLHRRTFIDKTMCVYTEGCHIIIALVPFGSLRWELNCWTGPSSIKCVLIWAVFFYSQGQKGHCGFSGLPGEPVSISQPHFDTCHGQQVEFSCLYHPFSNHPSVVLTHRGPWQWKVLKVLKWMQGLHALLLWHHVAISTLLLLSRSGQGQWASVRMSSLRTFWQIIRTQFIQCMLLTWWLYVYASLSN